VPPFVHDSHGDRFHSSDSWDQINGQRLEKTASIGFLLSKGSSKHVSGLSLPGDVIDLLAQDYTLEVPPDLEVDLLAVSAGAATIRLGDLNSVNVGIGVRVTVAVRVPDDLPRGTRRIVLTFPNALRIRSMTNADWPRDVPSITFRVSNFGSEGARAAARWWQHLIYGVLCLLGAALASLFVAEGDESGCGALIVALVLLIVALFLVGRAVSDLSIINRHALLLVSASFMIPLFLLFYRLFDTWSVGLGGVAVLGLVALVCWWKGWTRVEYGALVLMPGTGLGAVGAVLRHAWGARTG
jgi:hypothetical protein